MRGAIVVLAGACAGACAGASLAGCTASTPAGPARGANQRTSKACPAGAECEEADAPPPVLAKRAIRPDCDPAARNSDGTPKRAPAGPPSAPPTTLALEYYDFGPQASAGRLLGPAWWSWEGGGSFEICDSFDVRVAVFRGISRAEAAARYPAARSAADLIDRGLADWRYVEADAALAHIDEALAEIEGAPELGSMAAQLRATRGRIVDALGE